MIIDIKQISGKSSGKIAEILGNPIKTEVVNLLGYLKT
jgi:hypothetical protein